MRTTTVEATAIDGRGGGDERLIVLFLPEKSGGGAFADFSSLANVVKYPDLWVRANPWPRLRILPQATISGEGVGAGSGE